MNEIKPYKLTKDTFISISLVISIGAVIWFAAVITTTVRMNEEAINKLTAKIESMPSRTEFDLMKADIGEIKIDIKTLLRNDE